MSADVEVVERPRQRRRLSPDVEFLQIVRRAQQAPEPEIHVTRHVVNGREVISIDDSDEDVQVQAGPVQPRRIDDLAVLQRRNAALNEIRAARERRRVIEARAAAEGLSDGDYNDLLDEDDDDDDYVPPNQHIFSPPPPAVPPVRPAARNIGLGGALLVQNGQPRLFARVHSFLDRFGIFGFDGGAFGDAGDMPALPGPAPIPAYKAEFSHPKVMQSFIPSFPTSPSHDPKGKSSRPPPKVNFLCGDCRDPLYLAAPNPERRVYALRCGHLIDGKCLTKLGAPPLGIFPQFDKIEVLGLEPSPSKGKGKGKATRGKGKASAKGRGRKRKRVEKTKWQWTCPVDGCKHGQQSVWDEDAGADKTGAWVPDPEEGAILFYG